MTKPDTTTHTEQRPPSPTADQVRAARAAAGLSAAAAARLIYMDGRTWRYYEAGTREMHPAVWHTFRARAGVGADEAAAAWLDRYPSRPSGSVCVLREEELRDVMRTAYLAGRRGA